MWTRLRSRFWQTLTRAAGSADAETDRMMRLLLNVQQLRTWTEELQSAVLHMAALPTRQDVRRLHRRVLTLRRAVAEMEQALATLEAQRPAPSESITPEAR